MPAKFHSQQVFNGSPEYNREYGKYLEHVFLGDQLIGTIYQLVCGRFKFSCRYMLWNTEKYRNLQAARMDLALLIERNTRLKCDVLWEKKESVKGK